MELKRITVRALDGEGCAVSGIVDRGGTPGGTGCVAACVTLATHIVDLAVGYTLEVIVDESHAVGRESVYQLKFGTLHVVNTSERLKMLRTYGRDNANGGMHNIAYFLDVANVFGSHLYDEDLIVRLEVLADGTHYPERGIEAAGSHERVELLRKDAVQIMLRTGLAIAAGDTNHFKISHGLQTAACVADVAAAYVCLDRRKQEVG